MSFLGLDDYGVTVLTIFLLLIPAAFYIMGLFEGKKGHALFLAGIFFHVVSIAQRWAVTGRVPLYEKHDNVSFMAFAMALTYWYFRSRKGMKEMSLLALPLMTAFIFIAVGYRTINTISPFMETPWFYLHTFLYFISYAFFGISACIGVYYLATGKPEYETLQHQGIIHGWIMFSISAFMGSIWFYIAYGTYWLWSSREMWLALTWFYYGLYLHARLIRGLRGRPAGAMGIAGFAVALFTYFGIGTVIPSPPTQF